MNKDNRGVSLVELIVSLLILMLIFVPTITAFQTAITANRRAAEITYAETAASTVLEEIKYLGKRGVNEKALASDGGWSYVPGDSAHGIPDYYTLANKANGAYSEGTRDFDIRVYFDDVVYEDNANNYTYADISQFAGEGSVILNPLVVGIDFDNMAQEYFKQQYHQYAYSIWYESWRQYEIDYLAAREALREDPDADITMPTEPAPFLDPVESPSFSPADFTDCITKSESVILTNDEAGMKLNSRMVYFFDNNNAYGYRCESTRRDFSGFCENAIYADVNNIFIMYSAITNDLSMDKITLINGTPPQTDPVTGEIKNMVNVYIAIQAPEYVEFADTDVLTVEIPPYYLDFEDNLVTNYTANLKVSCQARMNFVGSAPAMSTNNKLNYKDRLLEDMDTSFKRICNVKVRVLPFDNTAAAGSSEEAKAMQAELESTVLK